MSQETITKEEILERPDEEVQIELDIAKKGHDRRQVMPVNEFVKELAADMPDEIQKRMMRDYDRLYKFTQPLSEQYRVPQEMIDNFFKEEMNVSARNAHAAFIEEKLKMPNKSYAKQEAMQAVNEILTNNPKLDDLKKVARVSFDLNGLKAVNDLAGTRAGDEYLAMAKEALESEELRNFAFNNGFSYVVCHESGDEFSAIIKSSDQSLDEENLNVFMVLVKSLLAANTKAAENVLDFNDETILYHYGGFTDKEWAAMAREKREEELAKIKKTIPEGYSFIAQISAHAATAYQGLKDARAKEETKIKETDTYDVVLEKMMGRMFDLSDRKMHEEKNKFKKELAESDDPLDNMLARVYARTEEEREQKKVLEKKNLLIVAMKTLDSLKNDLLELYKVNASPETIREREGDIKIVEERIGLLE
jgi:GGDEF domain-containing protein